MLSPFPFFKDLVVVELASVLAGPAVGMFFSEMGAKVIKIENKKTGGDITRKWKLREEDQNSNTSAYYHAINYQKESRFVDLSDVQERGEVLQLIASADIVISNFRPSTALKLGMDFPSLKAINPQLIFGWITAYGAQNTRPGFDVVLQAETGFMFMTGEPGRAPVKMPVALIDILTAHQLKEGILAALIHRLTTGEGSKVSVSLFDSAVASLANQASNYLNTGFVPQRMGSKHPNIAPYGDIFKTKDHINLLLAIGSDAQFEQLCSVLEVDHLLDKFRRNQSRLAHQNDLATELRKCFLGWNFGDVETAFLAKHIPFGVIRDIKELFELPEAQQLILKETLNGITSHRVQTVVFKRE